MTIHGEISRGRSWQDFWPFTPRCHGRSPQDVVAVHPKMLWPFTPLFQMAVHWKSVTFSHWPFIRSGLILRVPEISNPITSCGIAFVSGVYSTGMAPTIIDFYNINNDFSADVLTRAKYLSENIVLCCSYVSVTNPDCFKIFHLISYNAEIYLN